MNRPCLIEMDYYLNAHVHKVSKITADYYLEYQMVISRIKRPGSPYTAGVGT